MSQICCPYDKKRALRFHQFIQPAYEAMIEMRSLEARGNK